MKRHAYSKTSTAVYMYYGIPRSVLGLLAGGSGECFFPCLCRDDDKGSSKERIPIIIYIKPSF